MGSSFRRRVLAVLLSLVVALGGVVGVLRYAGSADERALAAQAPTEVLVVTQPVPAGTPSEDLTPLIEVRIVAASVVPTGAVTALAEVEGLITTVDLVPGEILLTARFVDPESLVERPIELPVGAQEITFLAAVDTALGGRIRPGDRIAIYATFSKGDTGEDGAEGEEGGGEGEREEVAAILLPDLLVTRVQVTEPTPVAVPDGEAVGPPLAPSGALLLTVAVDVPAAERLTFALEFGTIRVALLGPESDLEGSERRTLDNVFG